MYLLKFASQVVVGTKGTVRKKLVSNKIMAKMGKCYSDLLMGDCSC